MCNTYEIIQPPTTEQLEDLVYKSMSSGEFSIVIKIDGDEQQLTIKLNEINQTDEGFHVGGRDSLGSWVDIQGQLGKAATLNSKGFNLY